MNRPQICTFLPLVYLGTSLAIQVFAYFALIQISLKALVIALGSLGAAFGLRGTNAHSRERRLLKPNHPSKVNFGPLFNDTTIGIFSWNETGEIIDANDAFLRLAGYTRAEIAASPIRWSNIVLSEMGTHRLDPFEERTKLHKGKHEIREFTRRDGTRVSVLTGAALLGTSGEPCVGFAVEVPAQGAATTARIDIEARYHALVENIGVGVWQVDAQGRTIYANPRLLEMLDFTDLSELAGRVVHEFLTEESRQVLTGEFNKRKSGISSSYEVEFVRKDRRRVPILVAGGPILSPDGEPQGSIATVTDLTELRQAQEARVLSEKRFRALVENSEAAISIWDERGNVILSTSASERIHGYSYDELKGRNVGDFIHEDDRPKIRAVLQEVTQNPGKKFVANVRVLHRDGRWRICEGVFNDLRHDPSVGGIVVNYQDVTEREWAQEALRRSEERYRNVFEGARDAFFTISPTGIITSRNSAATTLSGIPDSEVLNSSFQPFIAPDDLPLANEMFGRAARGERCEPFEVKVQSKLGTVHMEFNLTPQIEDGIVVSILGIGRDVSQRRALEEQLRHAQKMDCVGQLAGGVAHDFNNLLTIVRGNAYLIAEEAVTPEVIEMAQEICDAADRGAGLTRQLLTFSRSQPVQASDIDLNDVVSELMKMLRRLIGENITLHVATGYGLPHIHADIGMMEQVLVNLTVNARDAMPESGQLTIKTDRCTLSSESARQSSEGRSGDFVRLTVTDTGSGIAPEHLPHIFEPFFTTKDIGKGTGLGLATIYGIVKQHHGWIEVQSELNAGTKFEIYLPVSKTPSSTPSPESAASSEVVGGNETILMVEDEAGLRGVVRTMLMKLGYRVLEASSGVEALKVWEAYRDEIDLVFTDIVMPDGLSGPQLAAELRKRDRDLKVLFTSGYSAKFLTAGAQLEPGMIYLQKPYPPKQLAEAIRNALQSPSQG